MNDEMRQGPGETNLTKTETGVPPKNMPMVWNMDSELVREEGERVRAWPFEITERENMNCRSRFGNH